MNDSPIYTSEKHHKQDEEIGASDESYEQTHDGDHVPHYQPVIYERPKGLKGVYQHPTTQVCLLGLYNALNGLGLSGQVDSKISANANAAVYATFAFASFFAGSVNNKLGSKRTLILGSLAYPLFIGSYLALNIHPGAGSFVIATGAILGVCAGLLWSAQGCLMLAYPVESQKGLYIGIFWSIFNLGGVVGAAVSFAENSNSKSNRVDNGTYALRLIYTLPLSNEQIVFLVLTFIGVLIPLIMTDPKKMIRTDGTKVTTPRHPSWKVEFYFLWVALRTDPFILLLFPLFFTSNWFYTWQFNDYNGVLFNIRTRSLNNFCYWLSQIVGSLAIGLLLDQKRLTRRARAFLGWSVLFVMVFAVHTWAFFYQKQYTRETVNHESRKIDFQDPEYPPRLCLYILCGLLDAMWQTAAYWMMGAMSNDPAKLAYFTGFYKSLQSAGAAGIWRADAVGLPFMSIFASTWALLVAGLIFALPMLYLRVHDTTAFEDEVLARMDDNGHVQSISDYHTRSITDPDFVVRDQGHGTHGNGVYGLPHQLQHRYASGRSTQSRRSAYFHRHGERDGRRSENEEKSLDLDLDADLDVQEEDTMHTDTNEDDVGIRKGGREQQWRIQYRNEIEQFKVEQLQEWLESENGDEWSRPPPQRRYQASEADQVNQMKQQAVLQPHYRSSPRQLQLQPEQRQQSLQRQQLFQTPPSSPIMQRLHNDSPQGQLEPVGNDRDGEKNPGQESDRDDENGEQSYREEVSRRRR